MKDCQNCHNWKGKILLPFFRRSRGGASAGLLLSWFLPTPFDYHRLNRIKKAANGVAALKAIVELLSYFVEGKGPVREIKKDTEPAFFFAPLAAIVPDDAFTWKRADN